MVRRTGRKLEELAQEHSLSGIHPLRCTVSMKIAVLVAKSDARTASQRCMAEDESPRKCPYGLTVFRSVLDDVTNGR
jgi:hypothetical protein